ncbi:zinc-dependent alcohol dehydrogenase family protein [Gemmatimonas sp.]|uniref:zinc-dependent alcohol dehydrogenase family protein n=2 Tax=Gemmatimonas sp. TaxID=1962908 RepID=UPI0035624739
MQRAEYTTRGPVPQDVIECVTHETPVPQAGEVLLEMLAAPINPSDVLTLTGQYGMLPPLPAVGGNEGVGRVAALGDGVTSVAVGQRVLLPIGSGTWASHLVASAAGLIPLPPIGDPLQLAMMSVNPPTASLLLSEFVALAPGDWVMQNAANSGVGEYVIQLAKRRGLRTVNVVRREDAIAPLHALGGDVVLVDGPDLDKRVADATGKAKIRLGFDCIGGSATDRIARSLAIGGTMVNYGALSGEACKIAPGSFVFRDVTLRGFWLAFWFRKASPEQQRAVFGEIATLIATGALAARVHATYPLAQIKDALAAAATGGRNGKILLVP